ncbi:MAG: iron (metal) dependent repressor, DtxR family [Rubrobacteraceae bacterium]|nr:iron (metal) dependent repressor, DtxR family [Rubrobacteraceae bacterium]
MDDPAVIRHPSASVEDYVKAIWEVAGSGAASTKDVAERLSIAPPSVTNMFVRLQEMGLVEYERYRGASLTRRGREEALRLIRRHRLIETFLLEHLGYSWREVHEEAERLEHAVSDGFTERLAEFLGHPGQDPHGDPIPAADGSLAPDDSFPLGEATAGQRVRISKVGDDPSTLEYLGDHGLVPGRLLSVREVRDLDGVITVEDEDGESHALGAPLAGAVFVRGE